MAERRATGKQSFSKHRQGFSLMSLLRKKRLARAVDPINLTVWTSAGGKHTSNKVKEEGALVRSHVLPQDVDDLRGNTHFTIACECSVAPSQHSAAHRVMPDIQCRSSPAVGFTLSSH